MGNPKKATKGKEVDPQSKADTKLLVALFKKATKAKAELVAAHHSAGEVLASLEAPWPPLQTLREQLKAGLSPWQLQFLITENVVEMRRQTDTKVLVVELTSFVEEQRAARIARVQTMVSGLQSAQSALR